METGSAIRAQALSVPRPTLPAGHYKRVQDGHNRVNERCGVQGFWGYAGGHDRCELSTARDFDTFV